MNIIKNYFHLSRKLHFRFHLKPDEASTDISKAFVIVNRIQKL